MQKTSNYTQGEWQNQVEMAITVCNADGIIQEMNDYAKQVFDKDGDKSIIGTNVLDCHPEPARSKLLNMLMCGISNTYTIEKKGKRKIIQQIPRFRSGEFAGLVEISFYIPEQMPHFIRS